MRIVLPLAFVASALFFGVGACGESSTSFQAHDDCPQSIDQYCAQPNATCPLDWSTAKLSGERCIAQGPAVSVAESCSGFNAITLGGDDTSTTSFYNADDGKLVAVVDESANFGGSRRCAASVFPSFTPPACATRALPCDPQSDAGAVLDGATGD